MSENLSFQGSLDETTVPDLFRTLIRSTETAVVSIVREGRHDSFYFREGKIVYAASSDPDLGLGEVLLAAGELSIRQYQAAMERAGAARRVGSVLLDLGYMGVEDLRRAMEMLVIRILGDAIPLRTGEYTIEFVSEFPGEITEISVETERLILSAMGRVEHWSLVERGIGSMERVVRQREGADTRAYFLELSEGESHVLGLLAEPQSIESACERSYLSNFVVCRLIWALLVVNLVENAEGDESSEKRELIETEYELEGEVEKFNTAYQEIFNLVFQKIGDYTYDFVDRVVARMSPQLLPYLSGMTLINESRLDVDQLLNNLVASGSENRREVIRDVLNELLSGWILEIRTEFGDKLEDQIAAILERLRK